MSESNGTPPPAAAAAPARPDPAVRDRRRTRWCWIPDYIPERFAGELGPSAVALYVALAFHAGSRQECHPSLETLAKESGLHRGTVKRLLPILIDAGLLTRDTRESEEGRSKTNRYTLLDPEGVYELEGAPTDGGEGRAARPRGSAAHRGGARSAPLEGRAARPPSSELDPEGTRSRGESAHTPCAAQLQEAVDRVCAVWMLLLVPRAEKVRAEHQAEIAAEAEELLRRGWTEEHLILTVTDVHRPRTEWPREWRARLEAKGRQPARTPPDPAEVAEKGRQAARKAEADRAALLDVLDGEKPSEVLKRRGRGGKNGPAGKGPTGGP